MTITQTVEIPESRMVFFKVPPEIPVGKAKILVTPVEEQKDKPKPHTASSHVTGLASLRGVDRGRDTIDAYFARKRADKAREDAQIETQLKRTLKR